MALIQKLYRKISYVLAPFYLFFFLFYGCAGSSNNPQGAGAPSLVKLEITPLDPSIAKGTTRQFTATGFFSDNSTQDLTSSAAWNSSNTTIATITNTGLATATAVGSTIITAASGAISGSMTLAVTTATLDSISVTSSSPTIAAGTTQNFLATGHYSDNSTQDLTASVIWSSSDASIATISNTAGSQGWVSGLAAGPTTITAASGGLSGSMDLTVTTAALIAISVTSSSPTIAAGTTQNFLATGHYSDNSTQDLTASVTWSSLDPSIAAVSNTAGSQGLVSGLAAGTTDITAASGGLSGRAVLTVTPPASLVSLSVTPLKSLIALGTVQQFTAMGKYSDNSTQDLTSSVAWSSSNAAVATISNSAGSPGVASAISVGTVTINAKWGGVSGAGTLAVATVVAPDLKAYALLGTLSGPRLYVSDTQYNSGNQPAAAAFAVSFYLSATTAPNPVTDALIGYRNLLNGLPAGGTNSATTTLLIPATLPAGDYYLCAMTDSGNTVAESDETNNARCVTGAYHIGPDLSVYMFSGLLSGTALYVSDTGINSGSQPAGAFTVSFYLSTAAAPNPSTDILVGTRSLSGLASGATNSATTIFAVPGSLAERTYYLCAMTDSGSGVAETSETNNVKCAAGTYKIGPDLVTFVVSAFLSANTVYVSDTEMNIGNQVASGFTVSFYLSLDTAYDSGDILLGSRNLSGLAGGNATNSKTTSIPIPGGTPAGSYYIIAVTDSGNVIIETNETNNIKASSGTVTVP
ncbi:MAG: Ig-like domain-containing protein [Nitrospirae bacterium]|nr:Ig-like domain-containing protein [Nitrospirota bacterium]